MGSKFHVLMAAPRSLSADDLGPEEADDGLGQRVVVRVVAAAEDGSMPASTKRSV
jgi:hypothetical protein